MSIPEITPVFKAFIVSLLKRANLDGDTISLYTDAKSMVVFRQAFTHKSYSSKFNYEYLEFRGDPIVNLFVAQYIQFRIPKLTSPSWLTRLKHKLYSKTILAELATDGNFLRHLLYGGNMSRLISSGRYRENIDYISMMEDSFEALFGAVVMVANSKNSRGVGYAISYSIIKSFYDAKNISVRYEDVFDAKSRLKEIYDGMKWKFAYPNVYTKRENERYTAIVLGFPLGDKTESPRNKIFLSTWSDYTDTLAYRGASTRAIFELQKYGINEVIQSPFKEKASTTSPDIPAGFKDFIIGLLKRARVNKTSIKLFTRKDTLEEFRMSFIDKSHGDYVDYFKYEGIVGLESVITEYIMSRFPQIVSEAWLTNIRINIMSRGMMARFAETSGFADYILYGKEMEENIAKYPDVSNSPRYMKMLENVFKAFIGAVFRITDKSRGRGVGYAVAYNFLSYYMRNEHISLEYTDVFNPKSRLKELYDIYGWKLDRSIRSEYDRIADKTVVTIVGYPKNNRAMNSFNEVVLARYSGRVKKAAEQAASEIALDVLDRSYNIRKVPVSLQR